MLTALNCPHVSRSQQEAMAPMVPRNSRYLQINGAAIGADFQL